jgi:hypothetical protein
MTIALGISQIALAGTSQYQYGPQLSPNHLLRISV